METTRKGPLLEALDEYLNHRSSLSRRRRCCLWERARAARAQQDISPRSELQPSLTPSLPFSLPQTCLSLRARSALSPGRSPRPVRPRSRSATWPPCARSRCGAVLPSPPSKPRPFCVRPGAGVRGKSSADRYARLQATGPDYVASQRAYLTDEHVFAAAPPGSSRSATSRRSPT